MTNGSDATYRCPKCGATAALVMPEEPSREGVVALKCLACAHIARVPRAQLEGAAARRLDSTDSVH